MLARTEFDLFFREETEFWDRELPPSRLIQQSIQDHWDQSTSSSSAASNVDDIETSTGEEDFEGDTLNDYGDGMDDDNAMDEDTTIYEDVMDSIVGDNLK